MSLKQSRFFHVHTYLKLLESTPGWNLEKNKQKLSNTLSLNFWQACAENKFFCVSEIKWLIVMKMKMIIKKQIA